MLTYIFEIHKFLRNWKRKTWNSVVCLMFEQWNCRKNLVNRGSILVESFGTLFGVNREESLTPIQDLLPFFKYCHILIIIIFFWNWYADTHFTNPSTLSMQWNHCTYIYEISLIIVQYINIHGGLYSIPESWSIFNYNHWLSLNDYLFNFPVLALRGNF